MSSYVVLCVLCVLCSALTNPTKSPRTIDIDDDTSAKTGRKEDADKAIEETITNLVKSLLQTVHEILPEEYDLPNVTYPLPVGGNLCLNLGKVKGIRSFKKPKVTTDVDDQGFIGVQVEGNFRRVNVVYKDIFLMFYSQKYKRGNSTLTFKSINVVGEFKVTKKDQIYSRILKNECVMYLRSLKVTGYKKTEFQFYHANGRLAPVTSYLLDYIVTSTQELLLWEMSKAIKVAVAENLPKTQATVCGNLEHDSSAPLTENEDVDTKSPHLPSQTSTPSNNDKVLKRTTTITAYHDYKQEEEENENKEKVPVKKDVKYLDSLFDSDVWIGG